MSTIPPAPGGAPPAAPPSFTTVKEARAHARAEAAYRKANRPWYKKKRFWVLGIIALIIVLSLVGGGDDGSATDGATSSSSQEAAADEAAPGAAEGEANEEEAAEAEAPLVVSAQELISDLEANALAASKEYEGSRVAVTGTVANIDASGDYFSLSGTEDFTLTNVRIDIDESHRDAVSGFAQGQEVSVTGVVTGVGEILGYSIDAETID